MKSVEDWKVFKNRKGTNVQHSLSQRSIYVADAFDYNTHFMQAVQSTFETKDQRGHHTLFS